MPASRPAREATQPWSPVLSGQHCEKADSVIYEADRARYLAADVALQIAQVGDCQLEGARDLLRVGEDSVDIVIGSHGEGNLESA